MVVTLTLALGYQVPLWTGPTAPAVGVKMPRTLI